MTTFAWGTDRPLGSVTVPVMVPVPPWANAVAAIPPSTNRIARLKTPKRTNVLVGFFIFSTPPIFLLPGWPVHPSCCSRFAGSGLYFRPTHYLVPIHTFCYWDLKIRSTAACLIQTKADAHLSMFLFSLRWLKFGSTGGRGAHNTATTALTNCLHSCRGFPHLSN